VLTISIVCIQFIAQRILDINENQTYVDPTTLPENSPQKKAQDEEIFQRTRLVNCGFFMHIILGDYVGAILGLVRDQSDWRLDPLQTIRQLDHEFAPVGEGNVVSVEFNMLYRWHATLSQSNEKWFKEEVFEEVFPGKAADEVTPKDFMIAAHSKLMPDPDLKTWTFGG
jgi:linoleate 10R-lipoxygenase